MIPVLISSLLRRLKNKLMKKLLFIFAVLFLCGCESKTPEKPVTQVVFIINNVSYNLTEEAYNNIIAYLEYLSEYYSNEGQSDEMVETVTNLIADGFADRAGEEVINLQDVETIIDETQKVIEKMPEVPVVPGLDDINNAPLTVLAYLVANNNLDDDLLANISQHITSISMAKRMLGLRPIMSSIKPI